MTEKYLVDYLEQTGVLSHPSLISAWRAIDRADFVRPADRALAYVDEPRPLDYGQTISQPTTVAFMLELLAPAPGQIILDVGTGSGFQAALLARVVGYDAFGQELSPTARGRVIGLEFVPALAQLARVNLAKYDFIKKGLVEVHCLNAAKGYAAAAPFDAIISAASAKEVPAAWPKQLKIGGRLVLPIDSSILLIVKKAEDRLVTRRFEGFTFVPFIPDNEPDE